MYLKNVIGGRRLELKWFELGGTKEGGGTMMTSITEESARLFTDAVCDVFFCKFWVA